MSPTHPSLRLEVVWYDNDMLELQLKASNGSFAGQANFYAALDAPATFWEHISGFPKTANDVREYEFGGTSMSGYGGAKIRLYCKDSSGHLAVQVTVYKNPESRKEVVESATVQIDTVPAAIDSFVEELQRMELQVGEAAVLQSAT